MHALHRNMCGNIYNVTLELRCSLLKFYARPSDRPSVRARPALKQRVRPVQLRGVHERREPPRRGDLRPRLRRVRPRRERTSASRLTGVLSAEL